MAEVRISISTSNGKFSNSVGGGRAEQVNTFTGHQAEPPEPRQFTRKPEGARLRSHESLKHITAMWPREPRLAAATSGWGLVAKRCSQSLWGFAAEQSEAGRSEKPQCLWRPARIVSANPSEGARCPVEWCRALSIRGAMWPRVKRKRRHCQPIR